MDPATPETPVAEEDARDDRDEERARPVAERVSRRRLGALLALALGLGVAALPLARVSSSERHVSFVVAEPASVSALELTWLSGDEALRSVRYTFEAGKAPARIAQEVSLSDGDYRVLVNTERATGASQNELRVTVAEGADELTVFLPK
jgi:hypothetical protein